jgi:hypothetical protein
MPPKSDVNSALPFTDNLRIPFRTRVETFKVIPILPLLSCLSLRLTTWDGSAKTRPAFELEWTTVWPLWRNFVRRKLTASTAMLLKIQFLKRAVSCLWSSRVALSNWLRNWILDDENMRHTQNRVSRRWVLNLLKPSGNFTYHQV